MTRKSHVKIQVIVFTLVSVSFASVYITQPVLPVLAAEFSTDMIMVSFTVSAVILGIAISNIPFGFLADRLPIRPIILTGGILTAAGGAVCAVTGSIWVLIGARFFQGIFIPALTTCLAAYLSKTLPSDRLNIVMGSYVSATVRGGLGGRLLGGWIHKPLHWRYAFITASALILGATIMAVIGLPRVSREKAQLRNDFHIMQFVRNWDYLRIYFCAAGSFFIFSSVFNYLPFRLAGEPFNFTTDMTTLFYLVYVVGIFMGTASGRISHRFGNGLSMVMGCAVLFLSLALLLVPSVVSVIMGLLCLCGGFFTVHAAAIGSLNIRLSRGQGQGNALYTLFYYLGGWIGISSSGFAYRYGGWPLLVCLCGMVLIIPLSASYGELKKGKVIHLQPGHSGRDG